MVNIHPSLEIVYAVIKHLPAPIDAKPGDEIIFRPHDPDFPIVVRRTLPAELAPLINERSLKMLHVETIGAVTRRASERGVGDQVAHELPQPAAARAPRTLRRVV